MTGRLRLKRLVKLGFLVIVLPFYGLYRVFSLVGNVDAAFQSFSQMFSLVPGKMGVYSRAAFYHLACPDTSDEICIGFLTVMSHRDTTIGKGVYIGPQCNIGMCRIGENTLIGSGVHVLSGSHQHEITDLSRPIQEQGGRYEKVRIGADCWLGNGAIVMADLADHCVLASGSVLVKHEAAKGTVLAGNPAKPVRNRFDEDSRQRRDGV